MHGALATGLLRASEPFNNSWRSIGNVQVISGYTFVPMAEQTMLTFSHYLGEILTQGFTVIDL